jgi:scyllo-inositol 2-dehydrogenase (NADP+)
VFLLVSPLHVHVSSGSHLIDQALVLFGPPQRVSAHILKQRRLPGTVVDDAFIIMLHYDEAGLTVTLRAGSLTALPGPRFLLHGTKGSFAKSGMDPQESQLRQGLLPSGSGFGSGFGTNPGTLRLELEGGVKTEGQVQMLDGCWKEFYDNLAQVVATGDATKLHVRPEQAALVIKVIEIAQQSNEQQRTLTFGA